MEIFVCGDCPVQGEVETEVMRERRVELHGTLRKGWGRNKFLRFHGGAPKIITDILLKVHECWLGTRLIRNRGEGANSGKKAARSECTQFSLPEPWGRKP